MRRCRKGFLIKRRGYQDYNGDVLVCVVYVDDDGVILISETATVRFEGEERKTIKEEERKELSKKESS